MPKRRIRYADALSHLLFGKPAEDLTAVELAELDVLRALDADDRDEKRYEQLAAELPEERDGETLH
jgi:hypothetical protein